MTWSKLGDDFTDRAEMFEASRSARLLLVEMYVWSNRMLTDGRVPANVLRRISDAEDPAAEVAELAAAGLVESADKGAWQLDWTDQETAEQVNARKDRRAENQRQYRDRKERHGRGDHSTCDSRYCPSAGKGVTGNEDGHVTGNKTPSRPVPSRPEGTGDRGQGKARAARAGATSAGATAAGAALASRPGADDLKAAAIAKMMAKYGGDSK